ncbi:T9SS type B sorting domain-containing protein [Flavobacterium sp.]|uniref:T9SS type B sorting domain-containing protein n=1 Tax=Flavobacterium sp. TaxID=239 RepID=UPI0038FC85D7
MVKIKNYYFYRMKINVLFKIIFTLSLLITKTTYAIVPPKIEAIGNQIYCPSASLSIVEKISITLDPTDPDTYSIYIQISSGYSTSDLLTLTNPSLHPTISIGLGFDKNTGILKLSSSNGNKIPSADFEAAIKDVHFSNSSSSPSGTRNFSISIGTRQISYLPRNKHFYEYFSALGITWTDAQTAANLKTYYGLQGYLATLTDADEAQLAGEQASGAGWIGGSDAETEGIWKWVTGPESGTTMIFTKWNTGEPNQYLGRPENYAHVTKPKYTSGIPDANNGKWNDLPNTGDINIISEYHPQGYIVEYGGMITGDVEAIQISASTSMKMSQITTTTLSPICGSGTINLSANTNVGSLNWLDTSGNSLTTAPTNFFTTPTITNTSSTSSLITTYYIDNGYCRIPITTTVLAVPTITAPNPLIYRCGTGTEVLQVSTSIGTVNWFSAPTGGSSISSGTSFTTPTLPQGTITTYFTEANNNGCVSTNRTRLTITTYKLPDVTDETVVLCKSKTVTLDAKIAGMNYLWSNSGGTNQIFTVSNPGIYTVEVTSLSPENCSKTITINVEEHDIPEIDRIDVNETTVAIYLKKAETYFEYSVDGINYQSSNIFLNVPGGLQTAYAREVNSCSFDTDNFIVLIAPKFFTPNNDSYNDFWGIEGLVYYPNAELTIFDRYGKFISQLNTSKLTWDGMLNKIPLPADDYWYVLKIDQTKLEKRGHFSLKR